MAQAAKVFIWVTEPEDNLEPVIHVRNTSEQPIYELAISWDNAAVATPVVSSEGGPFMPGADEDFDFSNLPSAGTTMWLDFRDAAGRRWRTTSEGELGELSS